MYLSKKLISRNFWEKAAKHGKSKLRNLITYLTYDV